MREITFREALREALREEMLRDERVFILGEDVGVYGGAFGVTQGLLEQFGEERVRDTPISEAAIIGAATGAALTGMRPVAEIMFMDFVTIGMDQIINQAAKIRYMFGGRASVPMVVRVAAGSGTGAAAQHSQTLEAIFCHIPGLKVVAPSSPADAKGLLIASIRDNNPVVFMEHKLLYGVKGPVPDATAPLPLGAADVKREGRMLTIISYSNMVRRALEAAEVLARKGISAEVLDLRTLSPLDRGAMIESVKKTGRALVVHEAVQQAGLGGEIASLIAESEAFDYLDAPIRRLGGAFAPMPYCPELEKASVPQTPEIVATAEALMEEGK